MKITAIIGTLNRSEALYHCLYSLRNQTFQDFEVIIVDQSKDKKTEEMIKKFSWDKIKYYHVEFKGLSKARNYALKAATGDFFSLIDDDAYYDEGYFATVSEQIQADKTVYSGYIWDTDKNSEMLPYPRKRNRAFLSIRKITRICPSAGLVIPMDMYRDIGGFDEQFGVGAKYGAFEETDLLVRGYTAGYRVIYLEKMKLKHPYPHRENYPGVSEDERMRKSYSYAYGLGAFFRKHIDHSNTVIFCLFLERAIRYIAKCVLLSGDRRKVAKKELCGLIDGIRDYRIIE